MRKLDSLKLLFLISDCLRLEYLNQPDGPYLTVASHRPNEDENFPNGFYLRKFENALWLRGYRADGFSGWPGSNEFIFIAKDDENV